jgi:hypothetical protein
MEMASLTTSSSEAGRDGTAGADGIATQRTVESRRSHDQTKPETKPNKEHNDGETPKTDGKKKSRIAKLFGKLEIDVPTVMMMMKYGELHGLWYLS